MFRFRASNAKLLEGVVAAVCTVVDEATFRVEPEGLKLRAINPSHVAMVDLELPKEAFDEYECADAHTVCVSVADLLKFLRRVGRGESVAISGGGERLTVEVQGRYDRKFSMPVLQPQEGELQVPKMSVDVRAKVSTAGLRQALEDAALAGGDIRVEADSEKLAFHAASSGTVDAHIELPKGETLIEVEARAPSKAVYSLELLLETVKAASALSDVATLELSSDMPLKAEFPADRGRLTFYLAPKVE